MSYFAMENISKQSAYDIRYHIDIVYLIQFNALQKWMIFIKSLQKHNCKILGVV